ncbi:MAG: LL-diaminopimelate aminotransferase [Candidatus Omnitrophica bacterium]|nr:LL-diaminopimelate aminotransferase [Candidatus Omnitrophota bacterium]MBU4140999.1 LL-diaminopimelate aminotransferase [Candidatus Omnitrophota bacterium]
MHEANRMKRLPLYLFTIIDHLKDEARQKGIDIVDLGMGNPDQPTPRHVVDELCKQARRPENHRYPRPNEPAEMKLKEAIADWYKDRFNVELDPRYEVLPLIGSKEGVAHLSLAFLNHDDMALVPSPAYPVHFNGVIMAGGILYNIPLTCENNFKPDLKSISRSVVNMAKMLFLSYPHNPTTTVVDLDFYEQVARWAKDKDIVIASDLAYSDIVFDGYKAPSILQVKGIKEKVIEFHTLSKSYNMPGWRIGYAVGSRTILASLAKTKSYIDFGIFRPIQYAAIKALSGSQDCVKATVETYKKRRDVFVEGLNSIGWKVDKPRATFYIWTRIPLKYDALTSMEFAELLVNETGVVVAPGTGFGEYGEGYVRFALVENEQRLKIAVERIKKVLDMQT